MMTTATETTPAALPPVRSEPLLACPFCGSRHAYVSEDKFCVNCPGCGARGPDFNSTDLAAIAAWNRRANAAGQGAAKPYPAPACSAEDRP